MDSKGCSNCGMQTNHTAFGFSETYFNDLRRGIRARRSFRTYSASGTHIDKTNFNVVTSGPNSVYNSDTSSKFKLNFPKINKPILFTDCLREKADVSRCNDQSYGLRGASETNRRFRNVARGISHKIHVNNVIDEVPKPMHLSTHSSPLQNEPLIDFPTYDVTCSLN